MIKTILSIILIILPFFIIIYLVKHYLYQKEAFIQHDIVFDKKTGYNFIPELFQTNVTRELICKQQPCVPCNKS